MKELDILEFLSENEEYQGEGEALRQMLADYQEEETKRSTAQIEARGKLIYKLVKRNFKAYLVEAAHQTCQTDLAQVKILHKRTLSLVSFMYWAAHKAIITINFANGTLASPAFFEDVYDCLSLDDLQEFYGFFHSKLVRMPAIQQNLDNYTILKICNNMMKRLSKSTFSELSGK